MSTTGQRQLKTQLRNAYLRGFRAGATGDRSSDVLEGLRRHRESAFARGYEAGKAALIIAENQADRYARRVLLRASLRLAGGKSDGLPDDDLAEGEIDRRPNDDAPSFLSCVFRQSSTTEALLDRCIAALDLQCHEAITTPPGFCKWCGRKLRKERFGDYGDGFFCGLRCGYQFGVRLAELGRRLVLSKSEGES